MRALVYDYSNQDRRLTEARDTRSLTETSFLEWASTYASNEVLVTSFPIWKIKAKIAESLSVTRYPNSGGSSKLPMKLPLRIASAVLMASLYKTLGSLGAMLAV